MDIEHLARESMARDGRDPGDAYWRVVQQAAGWTLAPAHGLSGELYRLVLANPVTALSYLARQAVTEHVGAATISAVGRSSPDKTLRTLLRRHALDEARHARMLRRLVRDRFQADVDQRFVRAALQAHHEFIKAFDGNFPRFICDSHAAELRTLRKLHHMEVACGAIEPGFAAALRPVVEAIIVDEMEHIAYTAVLIGEWLDRGMIDDEMLATSIMVYDAKEWDEVAVIASALEAAGMSAVAARVQHGTLLAAQAA